MIKENKETGLQSKKIDVEMLNEDFDKLLNAIESSD